MPWTQRASWWLKNRRAGTGMPLPNQARWWLSQNWKSTRFLAKPGAVSLALLAATGAAALLLSGYVGFAGWLDGPAWGRGGGVQAQSVQAPAVATSALVPKARAFDPPSSASAGSTTIFDQGAELGTGVGSGSDQSIAWSGHRWGGNLRSSTAAAQGSACFTCTGEKGDAKEHGKNKTSGGAGHKLLSSEDPSIKSASSGSTTKSLTSEPAASTTTPSSSTTPVGRSANSGHSNSGHSKGSSGSRKAPRRSRSNKPAKTVSKGSAAAATPVATTKADGSSNK